jgi:ABC-2 type transport system permease protein
LCVGVDFSAVISIAAAVGYMVLLSFLFTAFGIIIASLLPDFQGFQLIMNFLIMPLMFLSGAMFPLHTTPVWLQRIAKFNPLSYAVDGIRRALTGQHYFSPWFAFVVLAGLMVVLLMLGAYFFSRMKADS